MVTTYAGHNHSSIPFLKARVIQRPNNQQLASAWSFSLKHDDRGHQREAGNGKQRRAAKNQETMAHYSHKLNPHWKFKQLPPGQLQPYNSSCAKPPFQLFQKWTLPHLWEGHYVNILTFLLIKPPNRQNTIKHYQTLSKLDKIHQVCWNQLRLHESLW